MHLDDGKILCYVDEELSPDDRADIRQHLSSCLACSARMEQVLEKRTEVERRLAVITPGTEQTPRLLNAKRSFNLLHMNKKENKNMWDNLFARRLRPVWGLVLIAVVFSVAFAFPSVRAVANNFLGFFRVEQIAIVEINPANLPDQLGSSATFEELLSQDINFEKFGEPQQVDSPEAASAETGMTVRLPGKTFGEPELWVDYGSKVSVEVDLSRLRLLLKEIGRSDVKLPNELEGTTATLIVEPSVVAGFGTCDFSNEPKEFQEMGSVARNKCTMLAQIPSPSVSAPEGLNLAEIGRAFLQIMGMTESEAARFSDTIDWTTTLVVPIPQYSVDYLDVKVDGVDGVLFQQDLDRLQPGYMLLWVKDGIIYTLTGTGDGMEGVALANSIR